MIPGVTIEELVAEAAVLRVGRLVERLPGDEHRHEDGLAGTGRHLEGEARQAAVVCSFSCADDVERLGVADLLGGLRQVDRGLGGLDLAEEQPALAVLGAPVVEQVARRRRDVRVLLRPPAFNGLADLVDDLVRLLLPGPNASMVSWACDAFLGRATGTKNSLDRRRGSISPVTWPSTVTKCWTGSTYGELMTGFSMVALVPSGKACPRHVPHLYPVRQTIAGSARPIGRRHADRGSEINEKGI